MTPQKFIPNSEVERRLRKRLDFVIETCNLQKLMIGSKIKVKGNPIHLSTTNYPSKILPFKPQKPLITINKDRSFGSIL
jgi:hypothetical protein